MPRPDMSIKVERQLHDMRILGRIVGVRSTEQFVRYAKSERQLQYANIALSRTEQFVWHLCISYDRNAIFHFQNAGGYIRS